MFNLISKIITTLSKKAKLGAQEEYKDERRSTPWIDTGKGYKTRYAWVLSRGIGMVAEEEGDTTNNPLKMKVFPDLGAAITYKEDRWRGFEKVYPHFATLSVKTDQFIFSENLKRLTAFVDLWRNSQLNSAPSQFDLKSIANEKAE